MSRYKKVLAGVLATTMVLGSSLSVLADQGSSTGSGDVDVPDKSDIFAVVLPTTPAEGASQFNYILDPTGVIEETEAAKYNGAEFAANQTVYFQNVASASTPSDATANPSDATSNPGGNVSYSNKTDVQKVINKSTMPVDVTVKAEVAASEKITMAETDTFASDNKTASLYLALEDSTGKDAITATAATKRANILATDGAYKVDYDTESGSYKKVLADGYKTKADESKFQAYSFWLTGACNPNGEWDGLAGEENAPDVTVTWTVEDPTAAPTDAAPSVTEPAAYAQGTNTDLDIAYSLGAGASGVNSVSDVVVTFSGGLYSKFGAFRSDTSMGQYITIANDKITLSGEWLSYFPAGNYPICVVYDNDEAKYTMISLDVE